MFEFFRSLFGRWAFYETRDPWNVKTELREFLKTLQA